MQQPPMLAGEPPDEKDGTNPDRQRISRYGCAVAVIALAAAVRLGLIPVLGLQYPMITFFLGMTIAAWYGGLGPALLAVALSGLLLPLFLPPQALFQVPGHGHRTGFALFLITGLTIAMLGGSMRRTLLRAEAGVRRERAERGRLEREVGERIRAEHSEREQRERLLAIFTSVGDGVIVTDGEGRVASLNPAAEALTGWPDAEAVGRPMDEVFRIVNEGTGNPVESPVAKVLRDGVVVGLANHTALIARDGSTRPIDDSAAPIRGDRSDIIGVVLVFRDASAQRRHEAELREARQFLASSLDALTAHIAVLDEEGMILLVNAAWRRFSEDSGYVATDDGVGANYLVACGTDDDEGRRVVEGIRDVMLRRSPLFEMEYPCHGPDERRWFLLRATRFESEGKVRTVVAHENITRRKLAEEDALAAKDEAEAANRSKDQFLAVLSHELRTPLNPILLAATSMLERPPQFGELSPTLEMIRQNVALQARLIDDLLDVMRIVRGKLPLHWEVVDAHELIRQSLQICQAEIFAKHLRLDFDLSALEHYLNADPARFQQVIWNLVKNAVKFTPAGGSIFVQTRDSVADGQLVVEVSDTGIGIEPAILPTIFDPFQQGETKITRKFGGLGLGLAICKGIVESHGGTLVAESRGEGKGTTFRLNLKAIPSPVGASFGPVDDSPEAHSAPSSLKILVVEDEPTTRRLMARLLTGLGHEVTAWGTVNEAVDAANATAFDLIVSDIGLPDGSGLDLMRRVVAVRGMVPSIALTGYGMEEDVMRSREAGFTAHMTKPIDFTKLEAMIRKVTYRSEVTPPATR